MRRVLASVAETKLAGLAEVSAVSYGDGPRDVMDIFVAEKRRVLEASARALTQQASSLAS